MSNMRFADSLTDSELLAILGITAEEFDEVYDADITAEKVVALIATGRFSEDTEKTLNA